jgi:signal transduction histidine kinase
VASMARTRSRRHGIRARILAIAWIPSLLLLTGGIAVSGVLASHGLHTVRFTDKLDASAPEMTAFVTMVISERRASVVFLADPRRDLPTPPDPSKLPDPSSLTAIRQQLDVTGRAVLAFARERAVLDPDVYRTLVADLTRGLAKLPSLRQRIDSRQASLLEASDFYSALVDSVATSMYPIANSEPVPQAAVALAGVGTAIRACGTYLRADEFALAAAMGYSLTPAEYSRFAQSLGGQRGLFDEVRGSFDSAGAARLDQLRASPAWRRMDTAHNAILLGALASGSVSEASPNRTGAGTGSDRTGTGTDRTGTGAGSGTDRTGTGSGSGTDRTGTGTGSGTDRTGTGTGSGTDRTGTGSGSGTDRTGTGSGSGTDRTGTGTGSGTDRTGTGTGSPASAPAASGNGGLPTAESWNADFEEIGFGLTDLLKSVVSRASTVSRETGQSQLTRATVVGVLLVVAGIVVLLLTTRQSRRLIGRLRRLNEETLLLSRERLPGIVSRLRRGEKVDVATEVVPLDLGEDEIGQVAKAFNQAQETAIAAAVGESEARAGLRTVFLNIAHRSQGLVHNQLSLLDQAEQSQEDPDQLSLLFELDHLTTRARRNAENLIILGGGQVGRQWRKPVPLVEVVRGAISEARDYARVSLGTLPQVNISGGVVADLIHALAELVDNATSFSPPTSRVEVRGNAVGHGIALEIEDQGLGIEAGQLEQLNAMLRQPPDFQALALSDEPRLGVFVVAQLAARHGVRVTLVPSPAYGGTCVVVLIPFQLIDDGSSPSPDAVDTVPSSPAPAPASASFPAPVAATEPGPLSGDDFASLPQRAPTLATAPAGLPPTPVPRYVEEPPTAYVEQPSRAYAGQPPTAYVEEPSRAYAGQPPTAYVEESAVAQVPVVASRQSDQSAGDSRPPLPRRSRQAHLAPQLRSPQGSAAGPENRSPVEVDPELARRRLSAFQRGTLRAREGEQWPNR